MRQHPLRTSDPNPNPDRRCANTLLWTIYGVMAAKDIFVYGPNAIGLSLGIAQLLLKVIFPSK